jgi:hypothetical protein
MSLIPVINEAAGYHQAQVVKDKITDLNIKRHYL